MNRRHFGYALTAALAGCGRGGQARPLRLAMSRAGILYLPVYLAQSLGYFRENGVEVEFHETTGGSKAMEALIGGSADAMISGHSQVLQVNAKGRTVKTFVCFGRGLPVALVSAPGSPRKSIADLKGAKLGVSSPGSSSHLDLIFILSRENVRPEEVTIVGIGTLSTAVAALERGRVEAGMMFSNALTGFLRRNPSARILADLRTPEGLRKMTGADAHAGISAASTEKWLRENAESAKAICRALKRAMQWVANHRPEESWARLPAEYRSQDMEADLEAIRYEMLDLNLDGATTLEMANDRLAIVPAPHPRRWNALR